VRVPSRWLREHCDPGLAADELGELLALRTTEVERISYLGPPSGDGFVVGKVVSVEPHPDADRLTVCEVDTGEGTRTIVCGAPNVAPGQTVPVALPGAVWPGGERLGRAELRGVTSNGMILSEAELELGDDQDGVIVLSGAHPTTNPAAPGVEDEEAAGIDLDSVFDPGAYLAHVPEILERLEGLTGPEPLRGRAGD
jgi:phenylalanyl-tRNA synthetase beta chain